jgi:hypothetical protein
MRTLLVTAVLAACALATPAPWGALWLVVPLSVATALLLCWRWGPWGVLVPVALMVVAMLVAGPLAAWAWWAPVAALSGSWMGLREEGGGPPAGRRAWMLLPLLLLAAGLPWTITYPELVKGLDQHLVLGDRELIQKSREMGYQGERLRGLQRGLEDLATLRKRYLPNLLPTVLFLWMALLVVVGRDVSARIAGRLKWPELSRARLSEWRLPDGAIWLVILGLGLVLAGVELWLPTAWTLLIVPGLGYCVQGIAVVESLLLLRGVSPSIITLTLLFVLIMALPVFVLATMCVGLSDVWLDFRRLEAVPDRDPS